ncbi:MAG TPA: transcriptional repressor [Nitrospiria bacterium]|nr:transcriptional repressor [Nitrospiria bacterium]
MKQHKDLLAVLRHNRQRVTPARRLLLQFFIDNHTKSLSLPEIQTHLQDRLPGINRSSIYRNLEMLKSLAIIQELRVGGGSPQGLAPKLRSEGLTPRGGKRFQFVFERPVHHFIICKACGKVSKGTRRFFEQVEKALRDVHGFEKANLSVTFYGFCPACKKGKSD